MALSQEPNSNVIILSGYKDWPGLLDAASDLLKQHELDVKDARISDESSDREHHIYVVQDKVTGRGLPPDKLEKVRAALEQLGQAGSGAKSLPTYTQADLLRHTTKETGIWVSYKDNVYDITDFVGNHPGGAGKIMLAAGKALDPFWRIYQQHEKANPLELLAAMRIGRLADPSPVETGNDPYDTDPKDRHPGLIFHNRKPCNAELPSEMLLDSWLTPTPLWFIRHHHPVPVADPGQHTLAVDGLGMKPLNLSLAELKSRFPKRVIVSTVQCGGNRRSDLDRVQQTSGIPWGPGAISTARWGGVYLRELLQDTEALTPEEAERLGVRHIVFHSLDGMQASIPIDKVLNPYGDVLLAYEMNGEPLSADHGAPLRVIVPGVVGVRNVKWLSRITAAPEEATGPWQRGPAYKGLSPMVKSFDGVDIESVLSMQEMPVQSAIVSPAAGTVVDDDLEVRGWAWSGGGRSIVRVDVSLDEGRTWTTATLNEGSEQRPGRAWAWTFWEAELTVPAELRGQKLTVLCRATDSAYSTQPERPEPIWNLRGLNCNSWHRVALQHEP